MERKSSLASADELRDDPLSRDDYDDAGGEGSQTPLDESSSPEKIFLSMRPPRHPRDDEEHSQTHQNP